MQRIELVTERRRRFSREEKLRLLAEAACEGESISSTAKRHGIARSLLQTWKKQLGVATRDGAGPDRLLTTVLPAASGLVENFVRLVPPPAQPSESADATILVHVNGELVVEASPGVDAERLAAVIRALKG